MLKISEPKPDKDLGSAMAAESGALVSKATEALTAIPAKPVLTGAELAARVQQYDPNVNTDLIVRAYHYSQEAHSSQRRASGEPYFLHPVEVASILAGLRLDGASIVTALLHDTVEDTAATLEDIEKHFGGEVARLVDGVTKLTRLELQSEQSKQAENFRKLVLAMSEDIRVLLVKLADRLHNMRTLYHIEDPSKRRRIARETMDIYAPLAERIGMQSIKDELQDLSFGALYPDAHQSILTRLHYLKTQSPNLVGDIVIELTNVLAKNALHATITGREKSPYSIWRKMQQANVTFEQLSDIMAFRVLVTDLAGCYQALGILHSHYPVIPGRFKDYISTPKSNGYQSLHTGVIGPFQQRIEVQIRTLEMHEVSEKGVAAHWQYKQDEKRDGRQYRWLRELLEILDASTPEEFLEHTRLEMFQEQVFCFTPKGDIIPLPKGATPVDFAYNIHSDIGDRCTGARVNGRLVQLRTVLNNGDQIEIITSRNSTPSPAWEEFVVTGRAKASVRRFVRMQQRDQYIELGKNILAKLFRANSKPLSDKALDPLLAKFKRQSVEDLYAAVGEGLMTGHEVIHALHPDLLPEKIVQSDAIPEIKTKAKPSRGNRYAIPIRGLIPGMAINFAKCCHPLKGDQIVGIVTTGKGVTIHTQECDSLVNFQSQPERWLDVAWEEEAAESNIGRISVMINNVMGGMGHVCTMIAKSGGNIINLKITNRSQDFFELMVDIEVRDAQHMLDVIAALRSHPVVVSVDRFGNLNEPPVRN
jgi:GTP pyrophosphokinase